MPFHNESTCINASLGLQALAVYALCLLCFPAPAASYTYYPTAESCDIVGDGDIYGIGIRVGIYIQSFAAIVTLLGARAEDLRTLRVGFNAVATAVMINFLKDIRRNSFVYLEFWIIFALLAFILVIFNWMSLSIYMVKERRRWRE